MNSAKLDRIRELNQALKGAGYLSVSWRLISYPLSQATAEWSGEVRAWGGREVGNIEIVIEADNIDVVLGGLVAGLEERIKRLAERDTDRCEACETAGELRCGKHFWKGLFR